MDTWALASEVVHLDLSNLAIALAFRSLAEHVKTDFRIRPFLGVRLVITDFYTH